MKHVVQVTDAYGRPQLHDVDSLDQALALAERFINLGGASEVRVLREIPIEMETYVRVVAVDPADPRHHPADARDRSSATDRTGTKDPRSAGVSQTADIDARPSEPAAERSVSTEMSESDLSAEIAAVTDQDPSELDRRAEQDLTAEFVAVSDQEPRGQEATDQDLDGELPPSSGPDTDDIYRSMSELAREELDRGTEPSASRERPRPRPAADDGFFAPPPPGAREETPGERRSDNDVAPN